jgi:fucose permease
VTADLPARYPRLETRLKRTPATWIAYLVLIYFALILNCLGPVTSLIRAEQRLNYSQAGLLGSSFACGIIAASLLAARIRRKLGSWSTFALALVGLVAGCCLICAAKDLAVALAGGLLAGTLGSLIICEVPLVLVHEHRHLSRMSLTEANALASATAIFGPAVVGLAEGFGMGWRIALMLPFLFAIAATAIFTFSRPKLRSAERVLIIGSERGLGKGFWLGWCLLLFSVAVEFTIIFWASDFFRQTGLPNHAQASEVLVVFFGAMFIGRVFGSRLASKVPPSRIIIVSLTVAFCGSFFYCWPVPISLRIIGLALLGLGIANLYPTFLSLAISKAEAYQAEASAKTTLASGLAILLFPFVLGAVADLTTLSQAQLLIPLTLVAILCVFLCSRSLDNASGP